MEQWVDTRGIFVDTRRRKESGKCSRGNRLARVYWRYGRNMRHGNERNLRGCSIAQCSNIGFIRSYSTINRMDFYLICYSIFFCGSLRRQSDHGYWYHYFRTTQYCCEDCRRASKQHLSRQGRTSPWLCLMLIRRSSTSRSCTFSSTIMVYAASLDISLCRKCLQVLAFLYQHFRRQPWEAT
jgi:hypothetical protein